MFWTRSVPSWRLDRYIFVSLSVKPIDFRISSFMFLKEVGSI